VHKLHHIEASRRLSPKCDIITKAYGEVPFIRWLHKWRRFTSSSERVLLESGPAGGCLPKLAEITAKILSKVRITVLKHGNNAVEQREVWLNINSHNTAEISRV
jgi:hypothetical protein